jgi:hypothetical protein
MKRLLGFLSLALAVSFSVSPLRAQSFSKSDKLLIIVKGNVASTSLFGFSGQATLYQSTGTNADGTIQFSLVSGASNVSVERNSATDFTNFSNYGTKGFVPPGIYFLHYHSDDPGGEIILSTIPSPSVERTFLQFHIAFNNLAEYNQHVSEGCITLTAANFGQLFPDALFDGSQSPLAPGSADPNPVNLQGSTSSVLVFITDVLTPGVQDQQLTLFDQTRSQLKPSDFDTGSSSQLPALRVLWKSQGATPPPAAPKDAKSKNNH